MPRKIHFLHKSFNLHDVKLAELSSNSFQCKNVPFRGSKHTLTLLYIFRGSGRWTPNAPIGRYYICH